MDDRDHSTNATDSWAGLTRVAEDASGPRTRFEDFEIGKDLGTLDWSVTRDQVRGLMDNDFDYHEWYMEESPFGGAIVPPLVTFLPVRILFTRRYNVRGLFYIFECSFKAPIFYNEIIHVSGKIDDKWIKRDREYVSYVASGIKPDGSVAFTTRRAHVLDVIPRSIPREGVGLDSGSATVRSDDEQGV